MIVSPYRIGNVVLSEPSGGLSAAVLFVGALAIIRSYHYFGILHDGSAVYSSILEGGFTPSGAIESLPAERRQVASGSCVTAMFLLVGLLTLTTVVPETVLGIGSGAISSSDSSAVSGTHLSEIYKFDRHK